MKTIDRPLRMAHADDALLDDGMSCAAFPDSLHIPSVPERENAYCASSITSHYSPVAIAYDAHVDGTNTTCSSVAQSVELQRDGAQITAENRPMSVRYPAHRQVARDLLIASKLVCPVRLRELAYWHDAAHKLLSCADGWELPAEDMGSLGAWRDRQSYDTAAYHFGSAVWWWLMDLDARTAVGLAEVYAALTECCRLAERDDLALSFERRAA